MEDAKECCVQATFFGAAHMGVSRDLGSLDLGPEGTNEDYV